MPGDAATEWLEKWCDTAGTRDPDGSGLFAEVNARWQDQHPDAPPSLLQALAKQEEHRLALLVDRQAGVRGATAHPLISRLHRTFVSEFDPAGERAACRSDLVTVGAASTDDQVLAALADLTRSGYGSPLHLQVQVVGARAVVAPAIHSAPLPPGDFSSAERVAAYTDHMAAMVRHIGGSLSEDQLALVVDLDRMLWCDPRAEQPEAEFPWGEFLDAVVGSRARPWTARIAPATRRRLAAWWSAPIAVRRDWITCRLAYDLGPFTSEEALVRNSMFFAGRVLGITRPRSREERFVSFVKTAVPDSLARLYVEDCRDAVTLRRATGIVEALREQAIAWAQETGVESGLLRDLDVELGAPFGERDDEPADEVDNSAGATVCDVIRASRATTTARTLDALDDPRRDEQWRVQPYTAVGYYHRSTNKVVVPWALMREPLLSPSDVQAYALFGTLVAHEMAHAVVPSRESDWLELVDRARLGPILDLYHENSRRVPGYEFKESHHRELAADVIGFLWAHRAFRAHVTQCWDDPTRGDRLDPRFLRYWATRWRGARPARRAGFGHLDRHPPTELRCDIAPVYAEQFDRHHRKRVTT